MEDTGFHSLCTGPPATLTRNGPSTLSLAIAECERRSLERGEGGNRSREREGGLLRTKWSPMRPSVRQREGMKIMKDPGRTASERACDETIRGRRKRTKKETKLVYDSVTFLFKEVCLHLRQLSITCSHTVTRKTNYFFLFIFLGIPFSFFSILAYCFLFSAVRSPYCLIFRSTIFNRIFI